MTGRRRRTVAAATIAAALVAGAAAAPSAPAGDAGRGEEVYRRCIGCHSLERNRTGPKHAGLWGRRAGTVEGFAYSQAMRDSGMVWDAPTLDAFLADPRAVVPGTRMTYAGVKDDRDRADLIAYLKQATAGAP